MAELIWNLVSVLSVFGIGFIFGIAGPYARYLNASAKFMENATKWTNEMMDLSKKVVEKELY